MSKSEKIIGDIVNLFHNDYIDTPEFHTVINKYKSKEKNTSSLWHSQHELILKKISEKSDWYKELHLYVSDKYNTLGNIIYTPLILSTLSVGLFTLIANSYESIIDNNLLIVITGGCNLCSGTITGILKKWNLSKWITNHQVYSDKFLNISQDIKYQLSLPCDNREKMPTYLHKIASDYHEATLTSPKIPMKYIKSFKKSKSLEIENSSNMNLPVELTGILSTEIYNCRLDINSSNMCTSTSTTNGSNASYVNDSTTNGSSASYTNASYTNASHIDIPINSSNVEIIIPVEDDPDL